MKWKNEKNVSYISLYFPTLFEYLKSFKSYTTFFFKISKTKFFFLEKLIHGSNWSKQIE